MGWVRSSFLAAPWPLPPPSPKGSERRIANRPPRSRVNTAECAVRSTPTPVPFSLRGEGEVRCKGAPSLVCPCFWNWAGVCRAALSPDVASAASPGLVFFGAPVYQPHTGDTDKQLILNHCVDLPWGVLELFVPLELSQ